MTRASPAAALFFVSGAVALGCETAYFRWLGLLFGSAHEAAGALLAAFMAGLALGSELGARVADRLRTPARGYGLAETVAGLYALAAPSLFPLAQAPAAHAGPLARLLLAFALLAPPTIAMGASLPLLAAAMVPARGALRQGISRLYSLNLAGGVLGALATGFALLPRFGLRVSTLALGAFALAVGAVAVAVRPAPWTLPVSTEGGRGQWDAVGIAGGIGCVSFALQVAWNRVFALLLGSSAYTFALVVAAILAGLGFGGTAEGAREAEDDAEAWGTAARRCLALAIAVYVGMLVVHVAPFHLVTTAARGGSTALLRLALVALVVVWPSYQIGALFPLLAARFPSAHVGRATGRAALVATAGNVVGALGGAFVTVPRFGTQWTLAASAAVSLVLAVVAARRASGARLRGTLMAVVLACALGALLYPRWDPVGLSAGAYRAGLYRAGHGDPRAPCGPGRRLARSRVLFHRDGALGTVVVLGHPGGSDCSLYSLRVNGKAEGSVFVAAPLGSAVGIGSPVLPVGDLPVEVLAGWLPGRAGPPARDAFVVGWGTGFTARALVEAGAKHVTAVEIEPAVLDAARVFDAALLRDPRVTVQVDDARMALRRAPSRAFDVVVSHPSNPWVVGAASLFSREYWSLVRDRLRPGGRALAWVQLYEIDREAARTLVATFVSVFPDAHAFRVGPQSRDLLLLGFASDAPTSREALRAALAAPMEAPARAQLARAGFADGDAVMATHLADGAALVRYARGAVVNTDDSGRIEFRVADHVLAGTGEPVEAILRGL